MRPNIADLNVINAYVTNPCVIRSNNFDNSIRSGHIKFHTYGQGGEEYKVRGVQTCQVLRMDTL